MDHPIPILCFDDPSWPRQVAIVDSRRAEGIPDEGEVPEPCDADYSLMGSRED